MSADMLGPPVSFAVFLFGIWIGWRLATLKVGVFDVRTQGFYRGASKSLRVVSSAFGAGLIGGVATLLAQQFGAILLAYIGVVIVVLSIGIFWGAGIRGSVR